MTMLSAATHYRKNSHFKLHFSEPRLHETPHRLHRHQIQSDKIADANPNPSHLNLLYVMLATALATKHRTACTISKLSTIQSPNFRSTYLVLVWNAKGDQFRCGGTKFLLMRMIGLDESIANSIMKLDCSSVSFRVTVLTSHVPDNAFFTGGLLLCAHSSDCSPKVLHCARLWCSSTYCSWCHLTLPTIIRQQFRVSDKRCIT